MKASMFDGVPADLPEEGFDTLACGNGVRIERIVSRAHASPEGFWYDQEQEEFVLLLHGSAGMRIEGQPEITILRPGDYLILGARVKHRVEWTDPGCDTIWLAVHYEARTHPN